MINNFKYLIFDFDGTLADTADAHVQAFNRIHAQFDLPKIGKRELVKFHSTSMKEICEEYSIGPVKLLKIARALNQEISALIPQANFYPGIKKTLLNLKKNFTLGILSSNELSNIENFLINQDLPLSSIFSFWRCEKNLFGKDKALKSLMQEYKIDPAQVLYFGDQVRDVEACQKAGVQVVAVTWGFASEELLTSAKPDFLINQPSEIMDLLAI
jgi:phosphoglycolate phosphatase-like HAD superfamily hydrolase